MIEADALKPHEQSVAEIVKSLAKEMLNRGEVRDPLIIDKETYVILDGTHRFGSLELLKCRFVPCCLVDYQSPQIKVGSWFRLFLVRQAESLAEELLKEFNLTYSKQRIQPALVVTEPRAVLLTEDGIGFYLPEQKNPLKLTETAVLLEKAMATRGHTAQYSSEAMAWHQFKSRAVNFVIQLPNFSKKQIREFGLQHLLLPHKVTRHVIPSRPLHIDVPLDLLRDTRISQSDADSRLGELLNQKRVETKPAGSVVDGRMYEEELLVFSH